MPSKEEVLTKVILRTVTEDDLYSISDKYWNLYEFFRRNEEVLASFSMGVGDLQYAGFALYSNLVGNFGDDYIEVIPAGDLKDTSISDWENVIIEEINIYE